VLFFLSVFVLAIHLTFPSTALKIFVKSRLEDKLFSQNQSWRTPPSVEISDASLWRLSGVDLRELRIQEGSKDENTKGTKWTIDKFQMRLGIFAFLFGSYRIGANLEAYGASASGSFSINKGTGQLESMSIDADDLNLSKMAGLSSKIGMPLEGVASLSLDLDAGANLQQDASGNLTLAIENIGLMGASKLGKLEAELEIVKGTAKSKTLKVSGGEVMADANLSVKLAKDLLLSKVEGSGWFKPSDAFLKNPPGSFLARNQPEGKYYFKVDGTLGSPKPYLVSKDSFNQKGSSSPLRNMRPNR
jgi:type II secretion system protein N